MKKLLLSLLATSGLIIFSGCQIVDDFTAKKDEIVNSYEKFQDKIEETKKNIEEKKAEFDQKIQDLKDAQAALDKLFGSTDPENSSPEKIEERVALQEKITELESEKIEISEETAELQEALEEEEKVLEEKNSNTAE